MEARLFQILLAEDRPEDAELVRMALKRHNLNVLYISCASAPTPPNSINSLDGAPHSPPLDLCLVDMYFPSAVARTF